MNHRPIFALFLSLSMLNTQLGAQERVADVLNDRTLDMKRPADRAKAVERMKVIEDRRLKNAHAKGRALGIPLFENLPNGGWRELVDFDAEGPVFRMSRNTNAAISTGANLTWTSPHNLNGSGLIVGVWDGGMGRPTHQEFATGSRLVSIDGSTMSAHSMHVAGTIAAFGVNSSVRGMANAAMVHSYTAGSDKSEMTAVGATAAGQTATNVYTSNHSYGPNDGWNGSTWGGTGTDQNAYDPNFGQYNTNARDIDSTIYSTPYLASFWACGNDGTDNPSNGSTVTINGQSVTYNSAIHPQGDGIYRGGYDTINAESIGKNIIAIGAVNDAVTGSNRDTSKATKANLSSAGPADDGRIKPDLVANGVGLTSTGIGSDTETIGMSGTSMASPNACGSATLLVDQYKRLLNSAMRASTLKALLIHTADDIGGPGPDYLYGWGLINVKKGADLIASHAAYPAAQQITESNVSTTTSTRNFSFVWDGASPIVATLAWTDPAATAVSAHDSRTPVLVNNLNLKLIAPNNAEYFPYTMPFVGTWTVASMSQNATTGVNNVDNVEQVRIASPGQAGVWRAEVSYTGTITNTTQDFGLILSGLLQQPDGIVLQSPNGGETFTTGSSQTITWSSVIGGNVSIELLKNGVLSATIATGTANDGSHLWSIPSGQTPGNDYKIRVTSITDPGKTSTSAANFSIMEPPTLASALDTSGLTWTASGNANWFPQSVTTHDGVDAASSGTIVDNQTSSVETTLTGPGTLTFWWKVSSESGWDWLELYLNGTLQTGANTRISGEVDWVQKTLTIPSGSQTVKWTYRKDGSVAAGSDAGWVDEVVYTPASSPEIAVEQPVATDLTDGSATIHFGSVASGSSSSPFTFTIRNTGTANLTGLSLSKSGTHSADYALGSLGSTTLAPGASTTFTATFTPGGLGTRTASLQIASNDTDENPFDINLTGSGTGATYTVSFDANGGSAPSPTSKSVTAGSVYGTLASTSRAGFSFTGWFTDASGGTLVTSSTTVTAASDHTLYARWNALPVVNAGSDQTVVLTSAPWSPSQLTPQLWLDADDAGTITLNGSTVSQWRDKSGNARHASQTTAANQPTRTAAALNGKSVLSFDGTADFFDLGTGLDFLAGVSHSAFIVTKPTTFNNIYGAATGNANANSLHVGFNGASYRMNYWGNDYGPARTANFVSGTANIVNYIWTSGSSKQILANGKSEGISTSPVPGTIGTMSGGGRIGNVVGQGYIGGDIAEMIFLTGTVSTTDRERMEGYLAHKWGLTANLATNHTYKATAPGGSGVAANLDASATDTDTLTCTWSVVSGPGPVTFANSTNIDTTATFTVMGTYTLRLTANDGTSSVSDDVVITVSDGYPVTYHANNATSGTAPTTQNKLHDTPLTLQNNSGNLARTGYTFGGWNTQTDGLGTSYAEGASYTANAAVTLYAKWNATPYTAWASGTFANPFTDTALTSNPDGDNLTNLQEFAFGMDPTSPSLSLLTYVPGGTATPGLPILENTGTLQSPSYRAVFARRKDHLAAGITYEVQFSANLTYWDPSNTEPQLVSGGSTSTVDAVTVPFPPTVPRFAGDTNGAAPKFFRVAVSAN